MSRKPALMVVDIQNDFCSGGALPVKKGNKVIEPTNRLTSAFQNKGFPVVFTRDWHPADHCSFKARGGPWPPHCVKNTPGAEFHSSLLVPKDSMIVSKATRRDEEAYSGFQGTGLAERLRKMNVDQLYVAGLATDYCVMNTVLDGLREGFKVGVLTDCVRGVNVRPTDSANAFRTMLAKGAKRTNSRDLMKKLAR